jgi:tetratricopeptide (TPR) repeat protein
MPTPFTCPEREILEALRDGALPPEQELEVIRHLDSCEACRHALDRGHASAEADLPAGLKPDLARAERRPDTWLGRALLALERPHTGWKRFSAPTAATKGEPTSEVSAPAMSLRATGADDRSATSAPGGEATDASRSDLPDQLTPSELSFFAPSDDPNILGTLGPYEILRLIGRGGMGIVLEANDPALRRIVAVKILSPSLAFDAIARRRFVREAQAAAAVSHEHVVYIHAVDEAGGIPYLVMQLISGPSLQQRLEQRGPLGPKEVLRVGMQVASGLAAAHAQGLIHRDIKPSNIMLENGVERVKITDFGLARVIDDASLSDIATLAGTPSYMSPEQARGELLDQRSDLFSLGSLLYATCTGRPPFRADSPLSILRKVTDEQPRPIRSRNPEIPDALVASISRLMAKNPDDRYQSAADVAEVFANLLAEIQQPGFHSVPSVRSSPAAAPSPTARHRATLLLSAALGMLLLGIVVALIPSVRRHLSFRNFSADLGTGRTPASNQPSAETPDDRETRLVAEMNLGRARLALANGKLAEALERFDVVLRIDPNNAEAVSGRGHVFQNMGSYPQALDAFNRAIELASDTTKLYGARAATYRKLKNLGKAIEDYSRVIAKEGPTSLYHNDRGSTYFDMGKWDEALNDFTIAIEARPENDAPLINRSQVYWQKGEYQRSIEDCTRALQIAPNRPVAFVRRGQAHASLGEKTRALADLDRAIELDALDPLAHYVRAWAHLRFGNAELSLVDSEQAIRLDARIPEHYRERGKALFKLGRSKQALNDFKKAHELAPDDRQLMSEIIGSCRENGALEQAASYADEATRRYPDDYRFFLERAIAHRERREWPLALADHDRVLSLVQPSESAQYLADRGWTYCAQRDWDRAISDFSKAIELAPNNPWFRDNRAWAKRGAGRPADALPDHDEAIRLAPNFAGFYRERSHSYIMLHRWDRARADLEKFWHFEPKGTKPLTSLIASCRYAGALDQSLAFADEAIRTDPNDFHNYLERALTLRERKDWDRMKADLEKTLELKPEDPKDRAVALLLLSIVYREKQEIDRAFDLINQSLTLNPKAYWAYIDRALLFRARKQWDRAIADNTVCIGLDPTIAAGYEHRADAYRITGKLDLAIADLSQLIRLQPNEWVNYRNRANRYTDKKDWAHAISDYEQWLARRPVDLDAFVYVISTHREHGSRDRSLSYANEMTRLLPQNPRSFCERGQTFLARKEWNAAIADLTHALELIHDNPQFRSWICRLLGICHRENGNLSAALDLHNQAVADNPSDLWAYLERGYTCSFLNEWHKAMTDYGTCIKINPNEATVYLYRADLYQKRGTTATAIADLDRAIRLAPGWVDPKEKRALLVEGLKKRRKALIALELRSR